MKRRICAVVFILVFALLDIWSEDFKVSLNALDQHPEILGGFMPTGAGIAVNYDGVSFHDGDTTQMQVTLGGGYLQRQIFRNSETGEKLQRGEAATVYDVMHFTWGARLSQGFGASWIEGKDLFTIYAGYNGEYERYYDSLLLLKNGGGVPKKTNKRIKLGLSDGSNAIKSCPASLDEWLLRGGVTRNTQKIYPELQNDDNVTNILSTGVVFNYMDDRMIANDGVQVEFKAQYAPSVLNKVVDYYSLQLNGVAGRTLCELQRANGLNKFSIVVLDRVNLSWLDGNAVPVLATHPFSLGRKVRGFDKNSFDTNFAFVNNLDIRFASPEPIWDGIFVRMNLFFDFGYYAGNYMNTGKNGIKAVEDHDFLASTGFQIELSVFDSIDLGFQLAYLLNGNSIKDPDNRMILGATFFLDF